MKIAVGTDNPVKTRAVRNVMRRIHPQAEIVSLKVPTGMPSQPVGDVETRRGAANRAHAARLATKADWGVGIEGGVIETEFGMMTCAWCAVEDRRGRVGIGGSTNLLLPDEVVDQIRAGGELGPAMDDYTGIKEVKRKMGAIGVLTKGLTDRRRSYELILMMALVKFLWKGKYNGK